jgi:hypothetical protein
MTLRQNMRAISVFTLIAFAAAPALAKPDKSHKHGHHKHEDEVNIGISIPIPDKLVLQDFLRHEYRPAHCPPGLAKKNNGCLPPGIAKKYAMGKPLPPGIAMKTLPDSLLSRLNPMGGYQYVMVDKDILLVNEATKHVIDAVTLLSALD